MVGQPLTDIAIRRLSATAGERVEIWDSKVPGFGVRASGKGTKSFILVYRHRGRPRRLTLGRFPTLSLADARRKALDALKAVSEGQDPQTVKQANRQASRFDDAVSAFVAQHCRRHNRVSTAKETERVLRNRFVGRWGNHDIREVSRDDVVEVIEGIMGDGAPSAANHALAAIRKFFNWCVERGLLDDSPCTHVKRPAPLRSRDRVLRDDELARVYAACDAVGFPYGTIVKLMILTAQRRGEVVDMRWHDIDFDQATWTIPAERTKSNRQQVLPLVSDAIEILQSLPQLDEEFVFPSESDRKTSFSGFSKGKKQLDQRSATSDWTLHDLRRTAATGMARLGVAPHVVERILNHTSGTLGGVAGVYNRFGYLPEMRAALDQWAAHVAAVRNEA